MNIIPIATFEPAPSNNRRDMINITPTTMNMMPTVRFCLDVLSDLTDTTPLSDLVGRLERHVTGVGFAASERPPARK